MAIFNLCSGFYRSSLLIFLIGTQVSLQTSAQGRIFYDGFESGDTSLWSQADFRNRCQVVAASQDGIAGPFSGTKMLKCNDNGSLAWNDPAAFESLMLDNLSYQNELFIRVRVRADASLERTGVSGKKILRFFNWTGNASTYNDLFETLYPSSGLTNEGVAGGTQLQTYWGGAAGDLSANSNSWHKVEYYISTAGTIKVWHDGVLVRDNGGLPTGNAKWLPFYITSNWADSHGSTNNVYFDDFEVFSDLGSGFTGSMTNASIQTTATINTTSTAPTADSTMNQTTSQTTNQTTSQTSSQTPSQTTPLPTTLPTSPSTTQQSSTQTSVLGSPSNLRIRKSLRSFRR